MSSIAKLIMYHVRNKTPIRTDGLVLIRPIEKEDYLIHHDDIEITGELGNVH